MKEFDYSDFDLVNEKLGDNIEHFINIFKGELEVESFNSVIELLGKISELRKGLTIDINRHEPEKINGFAYGYTVESFKTIFDLIIKQSDLKYWIG